MTFDVRLAGPADLEALAPLRAALWPQMIDEENRSELAATLAGQPRAVLPLAIFVAESGGELLGFAEVSLRSTVDGCDPSRPCGYLEGWYVAPAHWRRGIGRALVEKCEDWSRGHGCTEMGSDALIDNDLGQAAHAALGFEVVDRCVNYRKSL